MLKNVHLISRHLLPLKCIYHAVMNRGRPELRFSRLCELTRPLVLVSSDYSN